MYIIVFIDLGEKLGYGCSNIIVTHKSNCIGEHKE